MVPVATRHGPRRWRKLASWTQIAFILLRSQPRRRTSMLTFLQQRRSARHWVRSAATPSPGAGSVHPGTQFGHWRKIGLRRGRDGSRSRLFNRIKASRLLYAALISIVALANEPNNVDPSTSPSPDGTQNTSPNPAGFASQNVCGGDLGMLQHAEDVINDILRPDGSEIYHCNRL